MAYTQTDLDTVDARILDFAANPERVVEVDGRKVEYRSVAELIALRNQIASVMRVQSTSRRSAFYFTPCGRRD